MLHFCGMAFKKSGLKGPVWTAEGRAKLSPQQHGRISTVLSMRCELYNTILESWQYQWKWHQRTHQYDDVAQSDVYDPAMICGDRGTLYAQFAEYRRIEHHNYASRDTVLWSDLAYEIGRGVINRFDKARTSFYGRCKAKREGANIKAGYPRFRSFRRWTTIEIPAPNPGTVQPPTVDGKWWKLRVKGLGRHQVRALQRGPTVLRTCCWWPCPGDTGSRESSANRSSCSGENSHTGP